MSNKIKIPRFGRDLQERMKCVMCDHGLTETDITFAGAGRERGGKVCFSYEGTCPKCNKISTVIDYTHPFTQSDWWEELGRWHQQALGEMGPYYRKGMPGSVARLLIGPPPLKIVYIVRGYTGSAGPVMLQGFGFDNKWGSCRLEANDKVRIMDGENEDNLPQDRWMKLANVAEGGKFAHAGREWTRLTDAQIQEILRDRVFTVTTPAKQGCESP